MNQILASPVDWGCRIHLTAFLQRDTCPGYDTKLSDSEVLVMLELSGMQSISSMTSLPDSLWPGVVAPERLLSISQIELFNI